MTREDWNPRARHRPRGPLVAGLLLIAAGAWQVLAGCAVAGGEVFAFSGGGHWYRADETAWGLVNLVIGAAAIAIGIGLAGTAKGLFRLGRPRGAVTAALLVAAASAMNQFLLAAEYPLWSSLVIAVDVFAVWALATQSSAVVESDEDDRIARLGARHALYCDG